MDAKALQRERAELFDNVYQFKHNKRVPLGGNFFTWKYFDAGYNLDEALYDLEILEKVNSEFHRIYQYDAYLDLGTRNPMRVTAPLGGGWHRVDETGEALVVEDHILMKREEFKEYMDDPMAFYWSKAFKRYCKPGTTLRDLETAVGELLAFGEFTARMTNKYINEYGAMLFFSPQIALSPFENLFNTYRGIRELSLDIRKCKSELIELLDFMYDREVKPMLAGLATAELAPGYMSHTGLAFLGHSILSVKQFEELYWPYIKETIDICTANNKRITVFCESTMERFVEFFQDIPKGVMLIHLEQDNIFEIRKKLPNIALAGGMPTDLLGYGTKEQCVDYAKKLIDELGEGYVLSQDKMMSYKNDATRENLLAVNEFVKSYQY